MRLTRTTRLVVAASVVTAGLAGARVEAAGPYEYIPITPCRVVDTRSGLGGYRGLLPNGLPGVKFTIKGAAPCNVPANATGVSVNLTIADTKNAGWVALYPGNQQWPGVSTINFLTNDFLANGAIVPLSPGAGDLTALAAFEPGASGTNMILDVTGYFVTLGGLQFYAITPCRIVDTQTGLGGFMGLLPNGLPATKFTIKGAAPCSIPADAVAIAVNATAVQTQSQGYLALYPGSAQWPGVSNVNFFGSDTIANGAIVPVSTGANDLNVLAAFAGTPGAYLELDLTGYFK